MYFWKKIQKFLFLIYFKKPSLCYVNQNGSKWYDADNAKAIKEYLDVQTPLGTTTSEVRMKTNHHNSRFFLVWLIFRWGWLKLWSGFEQSLENFFWTSCMIFLEYSLDYASRTQHVDRQSFSLVVTWNSTMRLRWYKRKWRWHQSHSKLKYFDTVPIATALNVLQLLSFKISCFV